MSHAVPGEAAALAVGFRLELRVKFSEAAARAVALGLLHQVLERLDQHRAIARSAEDSRGITQGAILGAVIAVAEQWTQQAQRATRRLHVLADAVNLLVGRPTARQLLHGRLDLPLQDLAHRAGAIVGMTHFEPA